MTTRRELATEEGDTIAAPDLSTDVGRAVWLLEYARARGFRLGPRIQIGEVILEVKDLRLDESSRGEPEQDIWEQHGHKE